MVQVTVQNTIVEKRPKELLGSLIFRVVKQLRVFVWFCTDNSGCVSRSHDRSVGIVKTRTYLFMIEKMFFAHIVFRDIIIL